MLDCAIIGSGPAGISAALTLKARNKSFVLLGNKNISDKVAKASNIANYPGLINVSGKEMVETFKKQLEEASIEIIEKQVTGVYDMGDHYSLLCNQEMIEAKTVILTTGVALTRAIPGELHNVGSGVSYCATCDGALYKDKEIAVIIQDESYLEEVEFLLEMASKIYLIPLKKFDFSDEKVVTINKEVKEIKRVKKDMVLTFADEELSVSGIFILKSAVAPGVLVPGIEVVNNHVAVNRALETNMKGLFAAGDVTGTPYQYAKAVGEGNVAAHSVVMFLSKK